MNHLKVQGIMLLLISIVCILIGWYAVFSDSLFASVIGALVFAGGVGAFAFGCIFLKFSCMNRGDKE